MKFSYCQAQAEERKKCTTQCDHCILYYAPLEKEVQFQKDLEKIEKKLMKLLTIVKEEIALTYTKPLPLSALIPEPKQEIAIPQEPGCYTEEQINQTWSMAIARSKWEIGTKTANEYTYSQREWLQKLKYRNNPNIHSKPEKND